MVKVQRRKTAARQTKRVWRQIFLTEWREYRGMTVEGLAAKAGVSPGLISQIENSISAGSAESLEKLARALDIEVGELLDIRPEQGGSIFRTWVKDENRERLQRVAEALKEPD